MSSQKEGNGSIHMGLCALGQRISFTSEFFIILKWRHKDMTPPREDQSQGEALTERTAGSLKAD